MSAGLFRGVSVLSKLRPVSCSSGLVPLTGCSVRRSAACGVVTFVAETFGYDSSEELSETPDGSSAGVTLSSGRVVS